MPRRVLALLSGLLLAGGVTACGSSTVSGDVVPKSTPEISTLPFTLGAAPAADDTAADTGTTGATGATGATGSDGTDSTGGDAVSQQAAPVTPAVTQAPVTPAPTTPAPSAAGGGAAATPAPAAPSTGGGSGSGSGGASADPGGAGASATPEFCKQNPGANDC